MPGITGVVYSDVFHVTDLIYPMLECLKHRGPQILEEATYKNIQVGITGGHLARTNTVIAGLDGAIHNHEYLCRILKEEGYNCEGASQSDLLVFAYDFWDELFLNHIRGDFAFFILDQKKGMLLLARDRLGKKPLYWFQSQHHFIFASELKALLACGAVPQTPSDEAISTYLYFGYTPQDMTPIKKVNKLLPANYLKFKSDKSIDIGTYWSLSSHFQKESTESKEGIVNHVDFLLHDIVKEQIPSTKPFGCFLGGGLGSASVAYYLQKISDPTAIQAYSIAFQDHNIEDLQAAEEVARSLHISHESEIITPEHFLDKLVEIAWWLDEPIADPHVISTWELATLAKPSKLVFSGMGSDELLAGHARYTIEERKTSFANRVLTNLHPLLRQMVIPLIGLFSTEKTFKLLQRTRIDQRHVDFFDYNAIFTEDIRKAAAPRIASFFDPAVFLHRFYHLSNITSIVSSYLYLDFKTRLTDLYIQQYERLLTVQQLEWKTPFLTQPIVEFLASLPEPEMLAEKDTFFVLKSILKNQIPTSLIHRSKRTRRDSLSAWIENPSLLEVLQRLPKGILVESGYISEKWLKKSIATPEKRKENFKYIWSILMLEIWFRLFIHRPIQNIKPNITLSDLIK